MGARNIELVHEVVAAVAGQDLDRLLELTDPEVEWHSMFALAEGGVYRGHDGIRRYVRDVAETAEVLQAHVEDTMAVGDLVLAVARLVHRGKGSGVETETPLGYVLRFRAGRIVHFRAFRDPEEVLANVGAGG